VDYGADPEENVEWAAFGFLFTLAVLFETDYIRGRSMKTEVRIRKDRSVTLTTQGAEDRAPGNS